MRALTMHQPASTSTLLMDGEIVKVETTLIPLPE
jgi:hypothetical protein